MKVLVTNPGYRNTLAVVRALGRKGAEVKVLGALSAKGKEQDNMAFHSRYCAGVHFAPDPRHSIEGFVEGLKKILTEEKFDVFLPVSTNAVIPVSKYAQDIRPLAPFPFPEYSKVESAHHKLKLLSLAEKVAVPIPRTSSITPESDGNIQANGLSFPLVIKTCKGANSAGVFYAHAPTDIRRILDQLKEKPLSDRSGEITNSHECMLQEYISGPIYDVCLLCRQGTPLVHTVQIRERTFPVNGGSGMLNRTCDFEEIREYAFRLMKALEWDGICMVEFKLDAAGRPRLMEVNPKFWGTLDLSIQAGVNFPYLACLFAMGQDVPKVDYRRGLRYRWIIPDGIKTIRASPDKLGAIYDFLWPFRRNMVSDLWLSDLKPTLFSLKKLLNS